MGLFSKRSQWARVDKYVLQLTQAQADLGRRYTDRRLATTAGGGRRKDAGDGQRMVEHSGKFAGDTRSRALGLGLRCGLLLCTTMERANATRVYRRWFERQLRGTTAGGGATQMRDSDDNRGQGRVEKEKRWHPHLVAGL